MALDLVFQGHTTLLPNPPWWSAVLWKRIMGTTVLDAATTNSSALRAWAHCATPSAARAAALVHAGRLEAAPPPSQASDGLAAALPTGARREPFNFHSNGGSIRFRVALRTYAPRGVRVVPDRPTNPRKIPTRKTSRLCVVSRCGGAAADQPAGRHHRHC